MLNYKEVYLRGFSILLIALRPPQVCVTIRIRAAGNANSTATRLLSAC